MNAERFAALLEAYGAEPRRWPAAERSAGEAFAGGVEGRAALAAELELDSWLDASSAARPTHDLRMRVLAAAPKPGVWSRFAQPWLRAWAPGAGLAAAGLAGVVFGLALAGPQADSRGDALLAEIGAYDEAVLSLDAAL